MSDKCPDCGHKWEDHEFGVPSPFCPPKSELAPVSGSVTGARDQQWIQEMCELVKNKMPEGYGFVVFGFPFNSAGRLYYASNGQREDVVKSLKEWIKHAEADFLKHK